MDNPKTPAAASAAAPRAHPWIRTGLLLLLGEKVIQHLVVTLAFVFDVSHMRARVSGDYRLFLFAGIAIALLFAWCLVGLLRHKRWVKGLIVALAGVDIIGEFLAQGAVFIEMNISTLAAIVLLILAALYQNERPR